jgi:hypothetical protein
MRAFSLPLILAAVAATAVPVASATTSVPTAPEPAQSGQVLVANFKASCADLGEIGTAREKAAQAGWQEFTPDPDMQVAKLLAFGMKAATAMIGDKDAMRTDARVMRQTLGGREIFLILSFLGQSGHESLGCRIYDFAATAPLDADALAGLTTETPSNKVDLPGMLPSRAWEPGLFAGHAKTQVAYVPQDSFLKQSFHLSGISLMSQTMEVGN